MKKKLSVLLLFALLLSLLSACGQSNTESEIPTEASPYPIAQLIVGTTMTIEKAQREEYNYDVLASSLTEPPLVTQDGNGRYLPLLCDFSTEDSQSWTYTVREGMKWDDGKPLTAEDILFTLQYEDQAGTANFNDKTDAEGKTAKAKYSGYALSEDGMSISLTLAETNVRDVGNMAYFRVMPKHIYEKNTISEQDARIGCGPYRFESFNKEAGTLSFVPNEHYPQTPQVGRIVFRLFGSEDTMYMALQAGDVDMVWNYSTGVSSNYAGVLGDKVNTLSVSAANAPAVLAFNNAKGFFADENLRLAVSYALDYSQFKNIFGSAYAATPHRGFVPATTLGYIDTPELTQDLMQAEIYMKKAGYEKNTKGYYEKDGVEASFALSCNAEKETHAGCAELIKTQLEGFGIHVVLDSLDKDSYNAKTSNKFSENNITMEAAIYGFTSAGMGMGSGLGSIYVDGSHSVQGGCQVFDPDFTHAKTAMDQAQSLEEYYAGAAMMQEYYSEHCPLIALYWDNLLYAYNKDLDGLSADALFGLNHVNNWLNISSAKGA